MGGPLEVSQKPRPPPQAASSTSIRSLVESQTLWPRETPEQTWGQLDL